MGASDELRPGSVIGADFEIERPLSAGGMGAVYVAKQLSTGKRRALKIMRRELVEDERSRRRFVDEAQLASRIESEHVVEVIAAGIDAPTGAPWLAMELLSGNDLGRTVEQNGRLTLRAVVEIFDQLGHALGQAHDLGIIHRDLKPENIFLARSRRTGAPPVIKILDFGIATFVASDRTAATATTAIGSPLWIAPEQMKTGAKLRPATDVWALGLVAFYLLTGKSYWPAAQEPVFNLHALVAEILAHPLATASERAAELGSSVPAGFDAWFARCVVRPVEERFPDARSACEALARLAHGGAVEAVPPRAHDSARLTAQTAPLPELSSPTSSVAPAVIEPSPTRVPALAIAIGVIAMLAIFAGGAWLWSASSGTPAVDPTPRAAREVVQQVAEPSAPAAPAPEAPSEPPPVEVVERVEELPPPEPRVVRAPPREVSVPRELTADDIRTVVQRESPDLQRCYEVAVRAEGREPDLRYDVDITIAPSGAVSQAHVRGQPFGGAGECIERDVRRWRFPARTDETRTHFPVLFRGSDPPEAAEAPATGSELSADQIRSVVNRERAGIQRCYETTARAERVAPSIRIDVDITIGGSGTVSSATARGASFGTLNECVERLVRRWRFPATGGVTTTSVPFVFQGREPGAAPP